MPVAAAKSNNHKKSLSADFSWLPVLAGVVLTFAAIRFWDSLNITAVAFGLIILVWLVFKLDSMVFGQSALVLLIAIPLLLVFGREAMAEQVAVYVYFLLVLLVMFQIAESVRRRHGGGEAPVITSLAPVAPQHRRPRWPVCPGRLDGIKPPVREVRD